MTRLTDNQVTTKLRRIEWLIKSGDTSRAKAQLIWLKENRNRLGQGGAFDVMEDALGLKPWTKRIAAIERRLQHA